MGKKRETKKAEVVVVTGASAGLGRAIACAFAKRGASVGLIARGGVGMDGLEGAKRDVEALGGRALILPCDVADHAQVEAAAQKAEEELGPIDVWVNDAMAYRGIPLQSAYCGFKHAIQGFADSLRAELLHDKSKVYLCMVQMPAMNMPQFEWVKNLLPNKPQPVPPIFQPEVAAEAVYWAAHHRRREIFVGSSTDIAIVGNKLLPPSGRLVPVTHGI